MVPPCENAEYTQRYSLWEFDFRMDGYQEDAEYGQTEAVNEKGEKRVSGGGERGQVRVTLACVFLFPSLSCSFFYL